jgi:hypothetical protein
LERIIALIGLSQIIPGSPNGNRGRRTLVPSPTYGEYAYAFPNALSYADGEDGFNLDEIERKLAEAEVGSARRFLAKVASTKLRVPQRTTSFGVNRAVEPRATGKSRAPYSHLFPMTWNSESLSVCRIPPYECFPSSRKSWQP